jgi:hypothetical protein
MFFSILLYADDLKIFFPVTGNSDFANAQAEIDVFPSSVSITGCNST